MYLPRVKISIILGSIVTVICFITLHQIQRLMMVTHHSMLHSEPRFEGGAANNVRGVIQEQKHNRTNNRNNGKANMLADEAFDDHISSDLDLEAQGHVRPEPVTFPQEDIIDIAFRLVSCNKATKEARKHPLLSRLGVGTEELAFIAELVRNCSRRLHKQRQATSIRWCPCLSPDLVGSLVVSKSPSQMEPMSDVSRGHWSPAYCHSHLRLAFIVPFRDRGDQLPIFLENIHKMLQRQLADYTIFVIEQISPEIFNKAMLMNAGFLEVTKRGSFDCVVFHDVDLLPEDDRNIYTCDQEAVLHLGAFVKKFRYELLYDSLVGGAVAFTPSQFKLVNGFANKYYGWGGEDDDLYQRIKSTGIPIWRYPSFIAKYTMMTHDRDIRNPVGARRYEGLESRPEEYASDGLNSVKYKVKAIDEHQLYIKYSIELPEPPVTLNVTSPT